MARLEEKNKLYQRRERERERGKEVERARANAVLKMQHSFNNLTFFCKFFYKASLE